MMGIVNEEHSWITSYKVRTGQRAATSRGDHIGVTSFGYKTHHEDPESTRHPKLKHDPRNGRIFYRFGKWLATGIPQCR